jgi:hypothetical protein
MDCITQEQRPSSALHEVADADADVPNCSRSTSASSQSEYLEKTKASKRNTTANPKDRRSSQLIDHKLLLPSRRSSRKHMSWQESDHAAQLDERNADTEGRPVKYEADDVGTPHVVVAAAQELAGNIGREAGLCRASSSEERSTWVIHECETILSKADFSRFIPKKINQQYPQPFEETKEKA